MPVTGLRAHAEKGVLDLIAVLAEHSPHPEAAAIADELTTRVVLLASAGSGDPLGIAGKVPDLLHGWGAQPA